MLSRSVGGFDVEAGSLGEVGVASWDALALPTIIALTTVPTNLADPRFRLGALSLKAAFAASGTLRPGLRPGPAPRVQFDGAIPDPPAVLLPFDALFEIRVAAAIRLWRMLLNRNPGPNMAVFSKHRCNRLILALRALDARLEAATYREIANTLFDLSAMSARSWKTHDLRDQAIRLARLGTSLMLGGYRDLLLHPYRRRP